MRIDYHMWWVVKSLKRLHDKLLNVPDNHEYEWYTKEINVRLPEGEEDRFTIKEQQGYFKELESEGVLKQLQYYKSSKDYDEPEDTEWFFRFYICKDKLTEVYNSLVDIYQEDVFSGATIHRNGKWVCSGDKIQYKKTLIVGLTKQMHLLLKFMIFKCKGNNVSDATSILNYMKGHDSDIDEVSLPTYKKRLNEALSKITKEKEDFMTGSIGKKFGLRNE